MSAATMSPVLMSSVPIDPPQDALPTETTVDPGIQETTGIEETTGIQETTGTATSSRQAARSRNSRQAHPVKVTVGDYSAARGNTASALRERSARETYALKSRELERAADERLAYEQQLVERRIRAQLEASQRELHSSFDEILEDTVILPRSIRNSENS